MERSWILVGMMGAGKSAIGRALAHASGRRFIDTDQMIQNRLGRSVDQVFKVYGEEAFRQHETSVLESLQPGPDVISTGGGIVLREANWKELKRLGVTIYLEASVDTLHDRLSTSRKRRPLLEDAPLRPRVQELLDRRESLYRRADCAVCVDDAEMSVIVERVLAKIKERE